MVRTGTPSDQKVVQKWCSRIKREDHNGMIAVSATISIITAISQGVIVDADRTCVHGKAQKSHGAIPRVHLTHINGISYRLEVS